MAPTPSGTGYWRQTRRFTLGLLGLWFTTTFVLMYFARELRFTFFSWPFPFYVAAQGALLVYLAIVLAYAWRQRARDLAFGVDEREGE